jgi:long-chain acyl-CoA synthetase
MTDAAASSWPAMSIQQAHALLTAPGAPCEMEEVVIRGIPTRTWKNVPATLRDTLVAARAQGEKIFLVHENERVSFEAFYRATVTFAEALKEKGISKGDRVAIVMRNLPEWPVAFYAAMSLGAIVTPLNAWWTGAELEYGLTDSGTKVAVMDVERFDRLAEHLPNCPDLTHVFVSRMVDEVTHPYVTKVEEVLGEPNGWQDLPEIALCDVELGPEDDATIFYTSGTTGKPKGALATHRNINSNIMSSGSSAARSFLRRGEQPPVADPDAPQKAMMISVPFFHATGCFAVLNPVMFGGGKIVMMRKWDAELAMQLIEREKVTAAGGVPTIAWQLIEHPARE